MSYVKQADKDKRSELHPWVQLPFGKRWFLCGWSVSWKTLGTAVLGDFCGSEKLVGNRSVCQHWNFHPFSTSSTVEKLPDTGLPEQCHAPHRAPNSSEEPKCSLGWLQRAQMPSAVQPEGGLSPAWGVLSLLLHHQCLKAPCFLWEQLCCKRHNLCRVIMFLFS